MVYKLIRVDTDEPTKVQLLVGKHVIGRGKFLHNDDTDKRVSRNHAELEVTDDSITLKSLHQNPCFYIKKDTVDTEILQLNTSVSLGNGDKFGLIPDNFWYKVVHCTDPDASENTDITENNEENEGQENEEEPDHIVVKREENDVTACTENNKEDVSINFDMGEEVEESKYRSASPSLLNTEPMDQESTQNYAPNVQPPTNSTTTTPVKRGHNSQDGNPMDIKKVKTEPVTPDPQPGPSNDQAASNADSKDQKPNIAAPASPAKPPAPAPLRERCMYGANCYRRNPQHKAQFSHPSDSDWGTGDRGVCPYGSSCRKNDPRHWQQNEHPPGVNPPDPTARRPGKVRRKQAKQKKASESEEDDDEDSLGADLIVTGKRTRKTVNRDTWLDTQSDEDEDPYKTDESDEWQPTSDFTNSDFSQNF